MEKKEIEKFMLSLSKNNVPIGEEYVSEKDFLVYRKELDDLMTGNDNKIRNSTNENEFISVTMYGITRRIYPIK